MSDKVIEVHQVTEEGTVVFDSFPTQAECRKAMANYEPGVYRVVRVLRDRVVVEPPPQPKTNVVDWGESTIKRKPRTGVDTTVGVDAPRGEST